jgi:hypothetical protein
MFVAGDRDSRMLAAMNELVEIRKRHVLACCDLRRLARLVVRDAGHEADFLAQRDTIASLRAQHARIADSLERLHTTSRRDPAVGAGATTADLHGRSRTPGHGLLIATEVEAFLGLVDLARNAAVGQSAAPELPRLTALAEAWHTEALRLWQLLHPGGQPELDIG